MKHVSYMESYSGMQFNVLACSLKISEVKEYGSNGSDDDISFAEALYFRTSSIVHVLSFVVLSVLLYLLDDGEIPEIVCFKSDAK
jgi:hypothetical protein